MKDKELPITGFGEKRGNQFGLRSILGGNNALYILVVDGQRLSFAMAYDEAVKVWKYNEHKYPEKTFTIEMVQ